MSTEQERTLAALTALADLVKERVASCHEEVACPKCGAQVGTRCVRVRGTGTLKHPHRERWARVVPPR